MFNHIRLRLLAFPLALLLCLLIGTSVSAQIAISVDSNGGTNIDLGAAGPGKSIDFFIGQDPAADDDLGAIFAVVNLGGGAVADPPGIISTDGAGTQGYFGAGNLFESTISLGAGPAQFEINQFFTSNQPIMTDANRELWFTLNLDTTGLADGEYAISLTDPNGSFRAGDGAFIAANNNLSFSVSSVLLGDVNSDGVVDFADIPAFIAVLSGGDFQFEADCDENGVVDFADIPAFIAILSGS